MKKKIIGTLVVISIITSNLYATYANDIPSVDKKTIVDHAESKANDTKENDTKEKEEKDTSRKPLSSKEQENNLTEKVSGVENKNEENLEERISDKEKNLLTTAESNKGLVDNLGGKASKIDEKLKWSLRIPNSMNGNTSSTDYALSVRKVGETTWMYPEIVTVDGTVPYKYANLEIESNTEYEFILRFFSGDNLLEIKSSKFTVTDSGVLDAINNPSILKNSLEGNQVISEVTGFQKKEQLRNGIILLAEDLDALRSIKFFDKNGVATPMPQTMFMGDLALNFVVADNDSYTYKMTNSEYKPATGTVKKGTGFMELVFANTVNHSAEKNNMMSYILKFEPNKQKPIEVLFKGLAEGSTVRALSDNKSVTIKDNIIQIDFDNLSDLVLTLAIENKEFLPIEVELKVEKDGVLTLLNSETLSKVTKSFNIDKNSVTIQQIPNFVSQIQGNGNLVAKTSLKNMYGKNDNIYPGQVKRSKFSVSNPTNRRYRLIDFDVKQSDAFLTNSFTLRNNSVALNKYYELFNPDYKIKKGSAVHVFNFEQINGISLYEGILKVYQQTDPNLKDLRDLDPQVIQEEIFDNEYEFYLDEWEGDQYADYAYQLNSNQYAVKESEKSMIELAQYHLFMNSLYFTFDTKNLGELSDTSTSNKQIFKYSSYVGKNKETKDLVLNYFKTKSILEPGENLIFDDFAYVLAGDLINDTYRPSLSVFDFEIDLKYGIVGIDGYLFDDANGNGIFDKDESVLKNTEVRLSNNGTVVSKTTTDEYGYYQFADVNKGDYVLEFDIDDNHEVTNLNQDLEGNRFDKRGQANVSVIDEDGNYHYNGGIAAKKILPISGGLTIEYRDSDNNVIATEKSISGNVGDAYDVSTDAYKIDIVGYTYKEVKGNTIGVLTESSQKVVYIYTKNKVNSAGLTVEYRDTDNNVIATEKSIIGNVGDAYDVSTDAYKINIADYTFKEVKGNTIGVLTEASQKVVYIYTKNKVNSAGLTVEYRDTDNNVIAAEKNISGNVGDAYDVSTDAYKINIAGYTFKEVKGNTMGVFTETAGKVIYVYSKNTEDPEKPIVPTKPDDKKKPILPTTGDNTIVFTTVSSGLLIAGLILVIKSKKRQSKID